MVHQVGFHHTEIFHLLDLSANIMIVLKWIIMNCVVFFNCVMIRIEKWAVTNTVLIRGP